MDLIKLKCENCGATLEVDSNADKIVCKYCKSEMLIDDEATKLKRIEEAKLKARQENHEQEMKERQELHDIEMKERMEKEEEEEAKRFKKGKFRIIIIVCAILDVFFCISSFKSGKILAGILAAVMAGLLIWVYLMKARIVKENKKGLSMIVAIIALLLFIPYMGLRNIGSSNQNEKASKLDISNAELITQFPMPDKLYGILKYDRKDLLEIELVDVEKDDFKNYINKCKENGYTIDIEETDNVYDAYNESGYNIRAVYSDYTNKNKNNLNITLKSPEEMSEFEWPSNGLATKVPQPKSNYGKLSCDNSNSFIVHVGNTTKDDYNSYVKECENSGYTLEHSKGEKTYSAKNAEGYKISLMYLGGSRMEISVKTPETSTNQVETSKSETQKTEEQSKTNQNNSSNQSGIRQDFKDAMDSYEALIDEYISFMNKYSNSDGTDLSLLNDYSVYMQKYSKAVEEFNNWKSTDLNAEEQQYYIEVQTRTNEKLINAGI